jgi:type IV secretion system protein TrbL
LLVGLIAQSAHDWQAAYNHTDNASMWTMVGLGFTCAYLAKTIPDLIQGLISGVSFGGGGALGGMAATALGVGAGVGAAAAASGLGGAAAMAGEAASAGQAAGLANLINDSIAGGSQPPTATGQMDMDGVKAGAATLSPRTGGNTQSANRPATAPASGSASAGASRAAKAISSVASGTAVAASMVGKLAALSVPGMEGAAALPAGGPRQMPSGGSEGDDTRPPVNFRDENLIRPAEPAPFSQSSAAKPPKE